jgi:shikimate 5-dehydrogenase
VILGAGGAARAAAAALRKAERVIVLSRAGKVQSGWPENVEFDSLTNIGAHSSDLLINATPVGMNPASDASLIEGRIPAEIVFDMVYTPAKTRLLSDAVAQGKTIVSGTVMFLAQAQRQFEIWTGRSDASNLYTAEQLTS